MEKELRIQINELDEQIKNLKQQRIEITKQIQSLEEQKESLRNRLNYQSAQLNSRDWASEKFDFSSKVQKVLEENFKLKVFRSQQLAAINAVLNKKNVLLLMPTGGGKSLCYQLPSIVTGGVTVVVSPLVSLMEDQIYQLRKLNITAIAISSNTSNEEKKQVFDYLNHAKGKKIYLLYVTPEWLAKSKRFMSALQKCYAAKKFDRIAIDEVHCVSTWGHDFRPDYSYLSMMKSMFPDIPIIGLTATATTSVLLDVQNVLDIPDSVIIKAPFDRPNLHFSIVSKPDKFDDCIAYLTNMLTGKFSGQCGIIYTATIKDCEEVAKELKKRNLAVRTYHAEMDKDRRKSVHEKWLTNDIDIIVGTVAFGMGIDKPDVRFVIHFTMPKSMEGLYQEAGRAGRDGQKAKCIVMYKLGDYLKQSAYSNSKEQVRNVRAMLEYCIDLSKCRHKQIGKHFEEVTSKADKCNKMCDNCSSKYIIEWYNAAKVTKTILEIIRKQTAADNNLTLKKLLDIWMKKEYQCPLSIDQAENVIANLICLEYIREDRNYTAYSINTYLKYSGKNVEETIKVPLVKKSNLDKHLGVVDKKRKTIESDSDDDCVMVENSKKIKP